MSPPLGGASQFPKVRGVRRGIGLAVLAVVLGLALPGSAAAFEPLSSYGSFGEGAGGLGEAGGIAISPEGDLYVAGNESDRIDVFAQDGSFRFAFGKEVNAGPGNPDVCTNECQVGNPDGSASSLYVPEALDFDHWGNLYVVEEGGDRVDVFNPADEFEFAFGSGVRNGAHEPQVCTAETGCQSGNGDESAGALDSPQGIVLRGPGVYVADSENNRIDVYNYNGLFTRAFGKEVDPGGGDVAPWKAAARPAKPARERER